jgi:membrane-associated phospholipid phosphatase
VWAAGLAAAFALVTLDVFVQGPLVALDRELVRWDGEAEIPWLQSVAWPYDKLGQRSVLFPILFAVAGVVGRRHRTWRPITLSVLAVIGLNLVVGVLKLGIGRAETDTGDPSVLTGGVIYPSGHSSNMVLTGGLIIYLLVRYTRNPPARRLVALVAVLTALTVATSMYIGSHWVTDLVAGLLVGGLLLQGVMLFNRATAHLHGTPWEMLLRPRLAVGLFKADGDRVDAVPVPGRRLGGVVEDVPEVRPAASAADLGPTHPE